MHSRTTNGFSLLELLVYVTILSATSILVVGVLLSLARSYGSLSVSKSIHRSAAVSLERLVREIRDASSITTAQSTFSEHPGVLVLETDVSGVESTVGFSVVDGALVVSQGGMSQGALTEPLVEVDSLIFRSFNEGVGVKVELELTGTRGSISKTESFEVSALLREAN